MFLRTLADAYQRKAICVILSGSGSDGTLGLKRVKEAGGIAIAQDPEDAEYDSMPRSAIATDLVDLILPAAEIPEKLVLLQQTGERLRHIPREARDDGSSSEADLLREIASLLRTHTGHDFSNYKRPTVLRRIARRMQVNGLGTVAEYRDLLRTNTAEIKALLADLLITVTNFFRDKAAFEVLQEKVMAKIFAGKTSADQVRVWVVGCATGEEAYSIAILLHEFAARLVDPPALQVFASDINESAIATARECRYNEAMVADVSPERLRQYFSREGDGYRLKKEIRDTVLFAPHNVTRDPPFSRLDLISCRNLLIYLNRDMQERILEIFRFALRRDGFLFLGTSESAEGAPEFYSIVDQKWRIYKPRPTAPQPQLGMPVQGSWQVRSRQMPRLTPEYSSSAGELHYKLIEKHAPPSVLVNEEGDIIHLSEHAGNYLHLAGGTPTYNLLKVIHPALYMDCRSILLAARHENAPQEARDLRVTLRGAERVVHLTARRAEDPESGGRYFLVTFEERDVPTADQAPLPARAPTDSDRAMETVVQRLEEELQQTRERIRVTVEQYETSIEELKASNEESQAVNEELRSASEELETGKEELQSLNEELTTVNNELKEKVDEVSRANADLKNLIAATGIGTIFLDRDLKIRRYTPAVQRVFNLIGSDLGRPLDHLTHLLESEDFTADATRVLETLQPVEREVRSKAGQWYIARNIPYRTLDDKIDGVVLSFIEITERRNMEQALREFRDRAELAGAGSKDGVWDWNMKSGEIYWSPQIYELLGFTPGDFPEGIRQRDWESLIHPIDRALMFDRVKDEPSKRTYDVDYRIKTKAGDYRWINSRARIVADASDAPLRMSGTLRDLTDRKHMDEALQESDRHKDQFLATLSHELRNPLMPLSGAVDLLRRTGDPAVRERAFHIMERQVAQLTRLIDDLLDISRIRLGKLGLIKARTELATVVEFAVETSRHLIEAGRHRLRVSLAPKKIFLDADAARLSQAVSNLLNNAAKYTPPGGEIMISARRDHDDAVIEVSDNGSGIPTAELQSIFELFTQSSEQSARGLGGLGVGLSLVKQLVEMHGGSVTAHSAGQGKGSEFVIRLPLAAELEEEAAEEEVVGEEAVKPLPRRVLVVDDNEHATEILAKWLGLEGHSVATAVTGATAIEKAREFQPEVICLDISLPDLDGYEVAARIRGELADVCIIAISGWLQENQSAAGIIDHYLLKPVEFKELRAVIAGAKSTEE
jgi:two-component system CheB/CheR fusion protein